ncbi:MAG TPA: hypothetical protein DCG39_00260 [Opitutae bacterium]|jgi:hypothetical protein|nr:hypothetical protein [Opitutae bacterium]|tara:strand:+ start:117 stop:326 length:210 start_codon:yes stop_codon:yes gene_type:complete
MSLWVHVAGWVLVALNTLCLVRLGILPMVFFARNYSLYRKIFWVSIVITLMFSFSEWFLVSMMLGLELK